MSDEAKRPAWVGWAVVIGFHLAMLTLFVGVIWFMIWVGTTQGGW